MTTPTREERLERENARLRELVAEAAEFIEYAMWGDRHSHECPRHEDQDEIGAPHTLEDCDCQILLLHRLKLDGVRP